MVISIREDHFNFVNTEVRRGPASACNPIDQASLSGDPCRHCSVWERTEHIEQGDFRIGLL